jgi:hypothetical protein
MAPRVSTKPASWTGDSDWRRIIQPSSAPVTGAARPRSGGAAAGRRRMPSNHRRKARAVPTRLR